MRKIWWESEQRKEALKRAKVQGHAFWICEQCEELTPKPDVDHRFEVGSTPAVHDWIPANDISWAMWMRRLFCSAANLVVLCKPCHAKRTADQRAAKAALNPKRRKKRHADPEAS
jgi:hypothetical protein